MNQPLPPPPAAPTGCARLAGTGFDRCRTNALALHAARLTDPLAPIRRHKGPIGR